jgi:hypothetical protein
MTPVLVVGPVGVLEHPGRLFHVAERHYRCHNGAMDASKNDIRNAISPGQARAARALIGWTQDRLIEATGIPKRTLARFELGDGAPQRRTLVAIRTALEAAGVEFIPENGGGAGVRLRNPTNPE